MKPGAISMLLQLALIAGLACALAGSILLPIYVWMHV